MKIKRVTALLMIFVLTAFLTGCAGIRSNNDADNGKLKVITTIFAGYDFVRQIAGDNVDLSMLLKPGAEAHSYEPTPRDIIEIQNCDIFIYVGGENDAWIDNILDSIDSGKMRTVKLLDCVDDRYEEETVEGMDAHEEHEHEHGDEHGDEHDEWDEHVWTSPANAGQICGKIASVLEDEDPDNADTYTANCSKYIKELDKLDEYIRQIVTESPRDTIVFGDRFPVRYFIEEYGLKYYAAFPGCSQENEASAATIAFLEDKVREQNIPVIFKMELSSPNMAQTIADDTGAVVRTFYSGHNISKDQFEAGETYLSLMYDNAEALKEALN